MWKGTFHNGAHLLVQMGQLGIRKLETGKGGRMLLCIAYIAVGKERSDVGWGGGGVGSRFGT